MQRCMLSTSFCATAYLHARLGDEAILVSLVYHVAVR